jgi:beta-phosphoglucomutase-like phosphatase (HAD superfamily)
MGFEGAIFDVDGVLVESPHERAWRETLERLFATEWRDLQPQTRYRPEAFTPSVYQRCLSGKPRRSGAVSTLEHFEVPNAEVNAERYAELKQAYVVELIEQGEFTPFPDALRFILAVRDLGITVAAASSSKNADLFLRQIRLDTFCESEGRRYDFVTPGMSLLDLFDADVCGRDFAQGKPHPEIFQTAADEMGRAHETCFVVEDAESGIQAAKAARMAALGIARLDDEALLAGAGADLVVTSLDDVSLAEVARGRLVASKAL